MATYPYVWPVYWDQDPGANGNQTNNIKYRSSVFPSGQTNIGGQFGTAVNIGLSGVKTFQGTIGIEFGHTTAVNIQNAQLRIYDRDSIQSPASGVNTKVAEIINHDGASFSSQGSLGKTSNTVGSGDAFWWGEPWPGRGCSWRNRRCAPDR